MHKADKSKKILKDNIIWVICNGISKNVLIFQSYIFRKVIIWLQTQKSVTDMWSMLMRWLLFEKGFFILITWNIMIMVGITILEHVLIMFGRRIIKSHFRKICANTHPNIFHRGYSHKKVHFDLFVFTREHWEFHISQRSNFYTVGGGSIIK